MTINKRIKRNIRNNLSFYIISSILTMLTSAFIIAAVSTGNTLTDIVKNFLNNYKAEDAQFTTYHEISENDIKHLEEDYAVTLEANRYKDVRFENSNIRIFVKPQKLNLYEIRNGKEPSGFGEALITQNYAKLHNINVDDDVTITLQTVDDINHNDISNNETNISNDTKHISGKTDSVTFKITGYTTKADYLYMLQSLSDLYVDNKKFGIIIVDEETFAYIDTQTVIYYSVSYTKDNELDFRKYINENYVMSSYLSNTSNNRISYPKNEGAAVFNMAVFIPPVLFAVVVMLIAMILGRIIKKEQSLLGTFLALGYSKKEIVRHYARYGIIPGVIGSFLGLVLAIPFTKIFAKFYIEVDFEKMNYSISYNIPSILIALFVPTILYCLTSALVARRLLRRPAIELLNHTGKTEKTIGVMKYKRTKIAGKLRIRSILGHQGRSIATIIGIALASMCILVGLIMHDSMEYIIDNGFSSSVDYEYLYTLNYLGTEQPKDAETVLCQSFELEDATIQLVVMGIEKDATFFPDKAENGSRLDLEKYYITSALASGYKYGTGDTITFYSIADLTKHTVKIAGIIDDDMHCYLYTGNANAAGLIGVKEGSYNMLASEKKLDLDPDSIQNTVCMSETADAINELMKPIMAVVYIIIVFGIILCIFILYLIINMIFNENYTTCSLMKVLGYSRQQIASTTLNVNHLLVIIGFILGIPMAYVFAKIGFSDTIEEYGMYFDAIVKPLSLLIGFVLIWISYEVSLILQKRKLNKLDMVAALKEARHNE